MTFVAANWRPVQFQNFAMASGAGLACVRAGDCLAGAQPQPPTLVSMAVQGVSHLAAQPTKFDDATTVQTLKIPFKGPSNNTMRRGFLPVDVLNAPLNAPVVPVQCGLSQFSNWLPATKTSLTVWKLAVFLRSFNRGSF